MNPSLEVPKSIEMESPLAKVFSLQNFPALIGSCVGSFS